MPHSDLHKKKKAKNYMILALLFGFIAIVWVVTMLKMTF